jgi:hypothetical protein
VLAPLGEAVRRGLAVGLLECTIEGTVVCAFDDRTVCALDNALLLFFSPLIEVDFVDLLVTVELSAITGDKI